ncbi:hypothetical protein SDC9_68324 [bioreactor metagenome]|uniref:Uncharacterized protein n=1 Tax=bioreactor metagenome TaxID=1076179 RepID=A0A644Y6Y0_9ZZZZ
MAFQQREETKRVGSSAGGKITIRGGFLESRFFYPACAKGRKRRGRFLLPTRSLGFKAKKEAAF